jgi:hypothetical protein
MTDLLWPQQRVDRDEDPVSCRGPEQRGNCLDPLVEVDSDSITAADPEAPQRDTEGSHLAPEFGVGDSDVLAGKGGSVCMCSGRLLYKTV